MSMDKNIIKQLKDIGLKQNESEIYLFLLQNGISTPPAISKGTNIARTNCYNILNSLKEKDVIDEKLKGKKKVYIARDPKTLKLNLERKIESLDKLVPDLEAIYVTQKNKPNFSFFDGWNEVKNIYKLSLKSREIYAIGSTDKLFQIEADFFEKYIKEIKKTNISFFDLIKQKENENSVDIIKKNGGELYSIKFLPEKFKENITDILIFDDNMALISLEEPIFGTIITNKPLSDTLKMVLKTLRDFI
jgi:sugar-specific transcriptional regulator TrmB